MTGSPKPLRSLNKDIDHRPSEHLLSLLLRLWPFSACVALCMCHMGCMLCTLHGACITQYACCLVCVKHVVQLLKSSCCVVCMLHACVARSLHSAWCKVCMLYHVLISMGTLHCVHVVWGSNCKICASFVHDVHVVLCACCIVWMLHDVQVARWVLVLCMMCMWCRVHVALCECCMMYKLHVVCWSCAWCACGTPTTQTQNTSPGTWEQTVHEFTHFRECEEI